MQQITEPLLATHTPMMQQDVLANGNLLPLVTTYTTTYTNFLA
jgi:hypothetical protein